MEEGAMTMRRGWVVLGGVVALAVAAAAFTAVRAGDDAKPDVHKKVVIFRSGGSWLGVQIADIDADRAKELGLKEEMGAEIQSVSEGSPAEAAGLKKGDVILDYQGTRIEGVAQLTRLVRETPPGRTTSIKIFRDGSTQTVHAKVSGHESDGDMAESYHQHEHGPMEMHWYQTPEAPDAPGTPEPPEFDLDIPGLEGLAALGGPMGGPRLGAMVDTVGEQLAEFFGVKQGGGVLVRSVAKGGAGDTAGLRAGDVIVRIDDEKISDEGDLHVAMRQRRGKEFKLTVVRDRKEQTLTIPVPPETKSSEGRHPGSPAFNREIQREVERALTQARAAQAEAGRISRDEVQRALDEVRRHKDEWTREAADVSRRAIEAAREASEAAREAAGVGAGAVDEDVDGTAGDGDEELVAPGDAPATPIHDHQQSDKDAIRRAVEEARRIRIEMQQSAGE
jgi:membrane-associated protease RseP (regulator of RpoE activity)